jgi:hypothetical protein
MFTIRSAAKVKFIIVIILLSFYTQSDSVECQANLESQTSSLMTTDNVLILEIGRVNAKDVIDGSALIEKMVQAALKLDNYSADYKMKVYKNTKIITEEGTCYFGKPRLLKTEVKSGSRKGSLAILEADGKIHGHLGGLLKYFSGTVSPDSDMARTKRTNRLNKETFVLDMCSQKSDNPLLLKRIYIDPQTYLPLFWEDYVKGKIWSGSSWHNVQMGLKWPNNFFSP